MPDWNSYVHGLQRIGDSAYAYLQPDGTWSHNNAGLLTSQGKSLLVDTLAEVVRTRKMLTSMAKLDPAAEHIDTVVITHPHPDHFMGLAALKDSHIVMSRICASEIEKTPPEKVVARIRGLTGDARVLMDEFLSKGFDYEGVEYVPPSETFEGELELKVGNRTVMLVENGPCHTLSDVLVFAPEARVAFGGDLLYPGVHLSPQYPHFENFIKAYDTLLGWDADIYVSGHRALCFREDLDEIRDYLLWLRDSVRQRYERKLSVDEAFEEMLNDLGPYKRRQRPQTIHPAIRMLYAEWNGESDAQVRANYSEYMGLRRRIRDQLRLDHPDLPANY